MFKEIGGLMGLMKNLPKIRAEMEDLQKKIGQIVCEGDAGGGMVKVKVNGHMEVVSCKISDELFKMNDKEMMEDLLRGAVNQGIKNARETVATETSKMASGLGLPAGMDLPGLK